MAYSCALWAIFIVVATKEKYLAAQFADGYCGAEGGGSLAQSVYVFSHHLAPLSALVGVVVATLLTQKHYGIFPRVATKALEQGVYGRR